MNSINNRVNYIGVYKFPHYNTEISLESNGFYILMLELL